MGFLSPLPLPLLSQLNPDMMAVLCRLTSADGNVEFVFQHNVCGRSIYAEGTVDAALFLAKKVAEGSEQRIFDMIDVLKAGAMR